MHHSPVGGPVQTGPMTLRLQVDRLADLGLAEMAGMSTDAFRGLADGLAGDGVLCVHPALVPPSLFAPLLRHNGRPGFVVEDMNDLDEFLSDRHGQAA